MSSDQRSWIERLSDKIPGYSGYVDRERRRDIDKLHREHLADRLRSLKTPLTEAMRDLTSGGRLLRPRGRPGPTCGRASSLIAGRGA